MRTLLYLLLGLNYLVLVVGFISSRSKYLIAHVTMVVALSMVVFFHVEGVSSIIGSVLLLWVFLFHGARIIVLHQSRGSMDFATNKFVVFGLYAPFSLILFCALFAIAVFE